MYVMASLIVQVFEDSSSAESPVRLPQASVITKRLDPVFFGSHDKGTPGGPCAFVVENSDRGQNMQAAVPLVLHRIHVLGLEETESCG